MAEKAAAATATGDAPAEPAPPVKRGRGRPKGSKNKPKDPNAEPPVKVPKKRGRPAFSSKIMIINLPFFSPKPDPLKRKAKQKRKGHHFLGAYSIAHPAAYDGKDLEVWRCFSKDRGRTGSCLDTAPKKSSIQAAEATAPLAFLIP
ncbi:uncharacterized protein SCHCODRAFT_02663876 [Schizophyllum commune H4-8]|uniref:uncharacterized protein n=1 Tax=Schizophyllum commune (strain H4-8 / FGSC 9210) TaxID=578458 RepID=UPI00215FCC62|nr:uncharacterized protein SCHCODRAFT_02663876 [Schizophyllum commune H4-8]KAI5896008.1 hypothetical protein SCHCODRAFT_02663876 [Schizophyllum commune H4-8]